MDETHHNLNEFLIDTNKLVDAKKYQQALTNYNWYRDNAIRIDPSQAGVRKSFFIWNYAGLALKYAPALLEIKMYREGLKIKIREKLNSEDFKEYIYINKELNDSLDTLMFVKKFNIQDRVIKLHVDKLFPLLWNYTSDEFVNDYIFDEENIATFICNFSSPTMNQLKDDFYDRNHKRYIENQLVNTLNQLLINIQGQDDKELFDYAKEIIKSYFKEFELERISGRMINY